MGTIKGDTIVRLFCHTEQPAGSPIFSNETRIVSAGSSMQNMTFEEARKGLIEDGFQIEEHPNFQAGTEHYLMTTQEVDVRITLQP